MSTPFYKQSPLPLIIDNEAVCTSHTFDVDSVEAPGTAVATVCGATVKEAHAACAAAQRAGPEWRKMPLTERRKILLKASEIFQQRIPEIIALETKETASSSGFAGFETAVLASAQFQETPIAMAQAMRGETAPVDSAGKRMLVERVPYGCVLGIAPWNAPVTLGIRAVLAPLAGGNTVILKTSEYSPTVHMAVMQCLFDAGLPKGVLNVLHVATKDAPEVTQALIAHPVVRKVNFTGSTNVGRIIAQICAKHLKPCMMELGGKNPIVVTGNADVELAANNIVFNGFLHQGQICMSASNLIVHASLADDVAQKIGAIMAEQASLLSAGRKQNHSGKDDEAHRLRPLFNAASGERVKSLYEDAVQQGAKLVGGKPAFEGSLVQPVVLNGLTKESKFYSTEAFAPMMGIIKYNTEQEAIDLANGTDYGLSASVYSRDETEAYRIASAIDSGAVHINGGTVHDDQALHHGGMKNSGWGRFNGVAGIHEFTQSKCVTFNVPAQVPFHIM
ncbi:aldehyde dehydrogenase [Tilletiopsis washingtonensis]|uniref:Aldehyde dehydrogenase n=1 Tax=Tilletiopsis washingtonensis TaxID=58919 RepID=A0A316Z7P8_9BASI|nr:aldehyde dehydrogenase [Tilletiopsis washingtonensis]PWN96193.1 aldehyde dehydrogenase [Tilletiopsis washingtonensis]